jgi:hypothetical protein
MHEMMITRDLDSVRFCMFGSICCTRSRDTHSLPFSDFVAAVSSPLPFPTCHAAAEFGVAGALEVFCTIRCDHYME